MERDTGRMAEELVYHAFLMNREERRRHLTELNLPEYIALRTIFQKGANPQDGPGKVYLRELADGMRLSMRQMSRVAAKLKERGLVSWSHDGDGSEGTYLSITDSGSALVIKNGEILQNYYGRVIESYGREEMLALLGMLGRLEEIMKNEMEDLSEEEEDDDPE